MDVIVIKILKKCDVHFIILFWDWYYIRHWQFFVVCVAGTMKRWVAKSRWSRSRTVHRAHSWYATRLTPTTFFRWACRRRAALPACASTTSTANSVWTRSTTWRTTCRASPAYCASSSTTCARDAKSSADETRRRAPTSMCRHRQNPAATFGWVLILSCSCHGF